VHREEGQVEAGELQPELDLAQPLVEHLAKGLGPVEVDSAHEGEDAAAEQDIVEVRDDEVGVVLLGIDRYDRVHDAGETADNEL
jgi:hypothetical protein